MRFIIAVIINNSKPTAISERRDFIPSTSPNWLAMILAMVFPVSKIEVGIPFGISY